MVCVPVEHRFGPVLVPHSTAGVDCCGCTTASVDGGNVELRCNECGAGMGVIQIEILRTLLTLDGGTPLPKPESSESGG